MENIFVKKKTINFKNNVQEKHWFLSIYEKDATNKYWSITNILKDAHIFFFCVISESLRPKRLGPCELASMDLWIM